MEKNLIIFGEDWGSFPSSTEHLTKSLLKKGWSIIWINSIGLRQPSLNLKDMVRLFKKLKQLFQKKKLYIEKRQFWCTKSRQFNRIRVNLKGIKRET